MISEKRINLFIFALYLLTGFIAYSSIITSFFLSDDFAQIGKVLEGDLSTTWGHAHGGFFRPLFIFSYIIETRLWGTNPVGYHVTNILLHVTNSFLVFILARQLVPDPETSLNTARNISLVAGLLFLLHPSHTESVSWISGRVDLIATLFCLLSLVTYIVYLRTRARWSLICSLCFFALALLAKESVIALPFFVIVISFISALKKGDRKTAVRLALLHKSK